MLTGSLPPPAQRLLGAFNDVRTARAVGEGVEQALARRTTTVLEVLDAPPAGVNWSALEALSPSQLKSHFHRIVLALEKATQANPSALHRVLGLVRTDPGISAAEVAEVCSITRQQAQSALSTLAREGWVVPSHAERLTRWHPTDRRAGPIRKKRVACGSETSAYVEKEEPHDDPQELQEAFLHEAQATGHSSINNRADTAQGGHLL